MKKLLLLTLFAFFACTGMLADTMVIVGSDTKLYDQPSVKGYTTKNHLDEDITVTKGMVFRCKNDKNGWSQIEYMPGITAFVMDSHLTQNNALPSTGHYKMSNGAMADYTLTQEADMWVLTSDADGEKFTGKDYNKVILFRDRFGNPTYTFTVVDGLPCLYTYDPNEAKFF